MPLACAIADIAVCRAGASSIFELAAARIPMILVPLGLHQSRGDQIINAKIFSKRGWATWCNEEDLSANQVVKLVETLWTSRQDYKLKLEQAPGSATAAKVGQLLVSLMRREQIAEPF